MAKEQVLELEEAASSDCIFGGKTVMIIDEAQELSKTSKGVTLKLLEKKRKDTYIILCTMNPDAFDKSIRSRGLFYTFRSPSTDDTAKNLFSIIERKQLEVPDHFVEEGIFTVAENAEGSVRMSVQILERCIAGGFFTPDEIGQEFGIMSMNKLSDIVGSIVAGDVKVFEEIRKLDPREFFLSSYRFVMDCLMYLCTKTTDADWKAEYFGRFLNEENKLSQIFNAYADVENNLGMAFKSPYFFCRLSEFFKQATPQSVPSRTVPRMR
jgi:DNA polymerase III gamma/tau subunit